jgi:hypothetical protein
MATAKFKLPKTLAECADQLYATRNQRLAIQKDVDVLQAQETALREHIINNLPKSNATGIAGKLVRVAVESKTVFQVEDWDQFRGYLVSHQKKNPGVWGLMNKAANQAGIKELWESGVKVPGVATLKVPTLSVNKL